MIINKKILKKISFSTAAAIEELKKTKKNNDLFFPVSEIWETKARIVFIFCVFSTRVFTFQQERDRERVENS